jgi:hypothetical protein
LRKIATYSAILFFPLLGTVRVARYLLSVLDDYRFGTGSALLALLGLIGLVIAWGLAYYFFSEGGQCN